MAKRIETKTSRTAEFTCLIRTQSYLEKRPRYKSDDYISVVIINAFAKLIIRTPLVRQLLYRHYPPGMYEYVIARTKCIDLAYEKALREGAEQVLIFGAGFDSRGIRYHELSKNAKIFELDAPVTQNAKVERLKEKGITLPGNLIFVPIDFDRESVSERLLESGFVTGQKTLFLLEGLTMYLQPESVDTTFSLIGAFAGAGSTVIFDHIYASVLRDENLYEGEEKLVQTTMKVNEKFGFGIEKDGVGAFLSCYGFEAAHVFDANALDDLFFRDEQGKLTANVNGTHCIVIAKKK